MVFKDLIRASDLQVPEPVLLLYGCCCCFFFFVLLFQLGMQHGASHLLSLTEKWKKPVPQATDHLFMHFHKNDHLFIIFLIYMHVSAHCNG